MYELSEVQKDVCINTTSSSLILHCSLCTSHFHTVLGLLRLPPLSKCPVPPVDRTDLNWSSGSLWKGLKYECEQSEAQWGKPVWPDFLGEANVHVLTEKKTPYMSTKSLKCSTSLTESASKPKLTRPKSSTTRRINHWNTDHISGSSKLCHQFTCVKWGSNLVCKTETENLVFGKQAYMCFLLVGLFWTPSCLGASRAGGSNCLAAHVVLEEVFVCV